MQHNFIVGLFVFLSTGSLQFFHEMFGNVTPLYKPVTETAKVFCGHSGVVANIELDVYRLCNTERCTQTIYKQQQPWRPSLPSTPDSLLCADVVK